MHKHQRDAFTLIEVLIVVIIMAVLAATIIPQFSSSTKDAKQSSLDFNLHTVRSQIEMYKVHHSGTYPTIQDNDLPQMTQKTDANGTINAVGAFGPYFDVIPANPLNDLSTVEAGVWDWDQLAPPVTGASGWAYDEATGRFWPNNTGWTP